MLLIFRPVVVVTSVSSLVGINIVKDWPSFWQRPMFVTFRLWMKHPNSRNLVSQVKRLKKPCLSPWFTYASPYHRSYSDSLEKMLKYSTGFFSSTSTTYFHWTQSCKKGLDLYIPTYKVSTRHSQKILAKWK